MQKECLIKSPIFLRSQNKSLIPPLIYKNKIYIISDKKLYQLLNAIGKFNYYVRAVRLKGYKYTLKWLKEHKLFNEHILEEVSYYSLDNNFKSLKTYLPFNKKNNLIANIDSDYFNEYFEKVILYHYIKDNKKEFNFHLTQRLHLIEKELNSIKGTPYFKNRKSYHQKQIFHGILNSFLNKMYFDPTKEFELINSLSLKVESNFLSNNLGVYKISGLKQYENHCLKTTNIRYKECLKADNSFKIKFIQSCKNNKKTEIILKKSADFIADKLNFEKEHICSLITKNSKSLVIKDNSIPPKIINIIEESYFTNLFKNISNSNLIISPIDKILKSILILNMESYNAKKLSAILEKSKNIYSEIVEIAQESTSTNLETFGYAYVE